MDSIQSSDTIRQADQPLNNWPPEWIAQPRWLLWRNREGRRELLDQYGRPASADDATSWTDYETLDERLAIADVGTYDGLAYVLPDGQIRCYPPEPEPEPEPEQWQSDQAPPDEFDDFGCEPDVQSPKPKDGPREMADDPHRLARVYAGRMATTEDGQSAIRWHREEFYRWDACSGYRTVPVSEIRSEITGVVKREFDRIAQAQWEMQQKESQDGETLAPPIVRKVTGALTGNVVQALASDVMISGKIEPPAWIGEDDPPPWPLQNAW